MAVKIKPTARQEKVIAIEKAKKGLKEYDEFFDNLKVGQNLYEQGMYDDFDVIVLSWDKEKGKIKGEYKVAGGKRVKTYDYWELYLEARNLMYP